MSFDLSVSVAANPVTALDVNRAFEELGAPLRIEDEPSEASGYFPVFLRGTGIDAYEGESAGGFELYYLPAADGESAAYSLDCGSGDDVAVAWIFALAVAVAGGGEVSDPQSGRAYSGGTLNLLRPKIGAYRSKITKRWEKLSAAEKKRRSRREGETVEVFKERLFLARAEENEVKQYLRAKLERALAAREEAEVERLFGLLPAEARYLEDGLDPCFRAGRADAASRYAARFSQDDVRAHLVASAGFVGMFACPYVAFLIASLSSLIDDATLARARDAAASAEMKAILAARAEV